METIPVLISIRSCARRDDMEEDETISMIVSGQMELEEDGAVIRYEESLDESLPPQSVTVTVRDEAVTMDRAGEYAANMLFRMGCRFEGLYHTPAGEMELAIYCTRLDYDLGEEGGEIQVSYQLDLNGHFSAVHDMEMHLIRQGDA